MSEHVSEMPRRYLAVWFPFLPSDRLRRMGGFSHARAEAPVCFIEKHRGALRIASVDQAALGLGIAPGLTLADARARVPHLAAIEVDHRADETWLKSIALFCDQRS